MDPRRTSSRITPATKRRSGDATARVCRGEAAENLLVAHDLPVGRERTFFERTAAAWMVLASERDREEGPQT